MKTKIKILAALLAAGPVLAQAAPTKLPECAKVRRINHVRGGNGAVFNEDCTTIYVLPPRVGQLTVKGYRPNATIGLTCDRLKKLDVDSNLLQDTIAAYTQRIHRYGEEMKEIERNLADGLIPAGSSVDEMEAKIDQLMTKAQDLRVKINQMQEENDAKKLRLAKSEGARGTFLMESTFPELLKKYSDANPGMNVVPMPIDQSYLSMNEIKPEDNDESRMPMVLRLYPVGIGEMPLLLDPVLYLRNKEIAPHKAPDGSKIFEGGLSGDIQLSSIGACAIQQTLGGATAFNASQVKDFIAATATYSYQVKVTRKHKIKYNFKELVRQIHEQTKKSGFFNSSTVNSFIDERSTGTWITFEASSNDTRFEYTDAYIREVKKEFLDRALAQIVSLQTGSPAPVLALIAPGKNGAETGADELQKCPNMYCQIGAAGLRVLNSIFGSETAVSNLLKTVSGEMVETMTEDKMVPVYGTYGFR